MSNSAGDGNSPKKKIIHRKKSSYLESVKLRWKITQLIVIQGKSSHIFFIHVDNHVSQHFVTTNN